MKMPDGVTQRLILIRHGEPEDRARGRCYGKLDVGLSARGRAQIGRVAHLLRHAPLSAIYSSPRRRATESAMLASQNRGLEIRVDDDLAEIDFGAFEGLTYDEVACRFPNEYSLWMQQPTRVQFPDGESFPQMQRRVRRAISRIRARRHNQNATETKAETVAIVSHGGVNRIVLATALRLAPRDIFRMEQSHAAVNVIDYYEETPVVRFVNLNPQLLEDIL